MWEIVFTYFIALLYLNRYTDNVVIKFIPTFLLFFTGYRLLLKNQLVKKRQEIAVIFKGKLLLLLCLLLLIGLIRNNNPTTTYTSLLITTLFFCGFLFFMFQVIAQISAKKNQIVYIYRFLVFPFVLFFVINLLFWMLKIDPGPNSEAGAAVSTNSSIFLKYWGIDVGRVKFPLASGINSYATLLGGIFTIILVYMVILRYRSRTLWISLLITIISLLLTDSRSALIYPVIVCAVLYWSVKRNAIKHIFLWPFIIVLGPFLLTSLLPILSGYDFFSFLSRSSEDLATGNARFFIWLISLNEFLHFNSMHIFGYGIYGHYKSGASTLWSNFFTSFEDASELVHPHNTALSVLFDYGYFGLIVLYGVLLKIAGLIKRQFKSEENYEKSCVLAGFLMYFSLISVTESFFVFYYLNTIYYCISFFFLAFSNTFSMKSDDLK